MHLDQTYFPKLNLILFLGSSFFQSAFYLGLAVCISKINGIESFGEYSYALAIATPLTVLAGLQLRSFILTKSYPELRAHAKWLRFIFPIIVLSLATILLSFFESWIIPLFIPIALIKLGELWSDLAHGFLQLDHGLTKVSTAICIRYVFLIICLGVIWTNNWDIQKTLCLISVASIISGIRDYYRSGLSQTHMTWTNSSHTLKTTLSLSLSSLFTALMVSIPRYLLKEYSSFEEVGLFSMLFYYYVIPSMIINYTCQGLLKRMGTLSRNSRFLLVLFSGLLVSSLSYFMLLFWFGESITVEIYGYSPKWDVELTLIIATTFFLGGITSVLHYVLMGQNIYNIQLKTNIPSVLITLATGMLLIPSRGIYGAYISFIAGLMVQAISFLYFHIRHNNE